MSVDGTDRFYGAFEVCFRGLKRILLKEERILGKHISSGGHYHCGLKAMTLASRIVMEPTISIVPGPQGE
jgi:hypothetical protein